MKTPMALAATLLFASLTSPSSARQSAGELVGTWRLVSATQRLSDGSVQPDPNIGPNGIGYIIYTATGQMCTILGHSERSKWATEGHPTDGEAQAIYKNLVAYCGAYSVNQTGGYVLHHVEIDLMPNRVGTDRKRFFTVAGDRLVLRPAAPYPPGVADWIVTRQRVRENVTIADKP